MSKTEDKKTRGQEGRLNGLVSLRGAKRRSNLIQNKEYANDKIANEGNIMRLRRSLRSLAMTGASEVKRARGQEDRQFNKSCHPEFISGSYRNVVNTPLL